MDTCRRLTLPCFAPATRSERKHDSQIVDVTLSKSPLGPDRGPCSYHLTASMGWRFKVIWLCARETFPIIPLPFSAGRERDLDVSHIWECVPPADPFNVGHWGETEQVRVNPSAPMRRSENRDTHDMTVAWLARSPRSIRPSWAPEDGESQV